MPAPHTHGGMVLPAVGRAREGLVDLPCLNALLAKALAVEHGGGQGEVWVWEECLHGVRPFADDRYTITEKPTKVNEHVEIWWALLSLVVVGRLGDVKHLMVADFAYHTDDLNHEYLFGVGVMALGQEG